MVRCKLHKHLKGNSTFVQLLFQNMSGKDEPTSSLIATDSFPS